MQSNHPTFSLNFKMLCQTCPCVSFNWKPSKCQLIFIIYLLLNKCEVQFWSTQYITTIVNAYYNNHQVIVQLCVTIISSTIQLSFSAKNSCIQPMLIAKWFPPNIILCLVHIKNILAFHYILLFFLESIINKFWQCVFDK